MVRAVIIDDEDHARENLRIILSSNFSQVKIVGEADSMASGVQIIKDKDPELVFLDIDLSDGSGFNVLEKIDQLRFNVIFISAYNNFAIKAFRYNALDYLVKPINISELREALNKIITKDKSKYVSHQDLASVIESMGKKDEDKKLVIRNNNSITYIIVKNIIRCQADGNYTTIFLLNGEHVMASKPLREYASILPQSIFFRVHQSHLINLRFVKQFSKDEGGYLIMDDNTQVVIARRRKDEFFAKLDKLSLGG